MAQGLFDERKRKEVPVKTYTPASTFALLHMAGGNYHMTRQSPMEVMTNLAYTVSLFELYNVLYSQLFGERRSS
jgi:hypothetical protein